MRFAVLTGSQNIDGDQLSLLTTSPLGEGQPFGTGGGLTIPVPPDCHHADSVLVIAGHSSADIATCWQLLGPVDQKLSLEWLSNHGEAAKISL